MKSKIPSFVSADEAAAVIADGACIAVSGFCTVGHAQAVFEAMIRRYEREASPGDLTVYHAAGHGTGTGCDSMARAGLIRKVVGGHWGLMHTLREMMMRNEIEAHNWPQGMMVRAFREMARGERYGFLSTVGLGTFIDPRDWGGCINDKARETGSLIALETRPDGSEALRYRSLPIDVAIIRGWTADRYGNIGLGMEALSLSQLDIALATRAQGGTVICQVRERVDRAFAAHEIAVPGYLIDYVALADNPQSTHRQSEGYEADTALICPIDGVSTSTALPPVPEGARGWIGRRAAMEIRPGDVFNLGIGIPGETVTAALAEAGRLDEALATLESGVSGGVTVGGNNFGITVGPTSRMDQGAMFDFYHGGGLDITVMGAAEIGENGDINVSLFNGRPTGCGGFIDITQNARRIVFCSTLTAGNLEIAYRDGKVVIGQEGRFRKFVRKVQQVTFSAAQANRRGLEVLLVTERCVLRLNGKDGENGEDGGGWTLIEVAPGVDVECDILAHMDFRPEIAADLKTMPEGCFR